METKIKFNGIDANNEISLLEYGLLVSQYEHEDGSGTHFVVYRIDEDNFGTGHTSEEDLNNIVNGEEWAKEEDIKLFMDFCGLTKTDWLGMSLVNKLHDLIQYWGYENIMGTDYAPISEDEAKEMYL
jgi:hypothetical protein